MSDNDLFPGLPAQIYAFAIDGSAAGASIHHQPQQIAISLDALPQTCDATLPPSGPSRRCPDG